MATGYQNWPPTTSLATPPRHGNNIGLPPHTNIALRHYLISLHYWSLPSRHYWLTPVTLGCHATSLIHCHLHIAYCFFTYHVLGQLPLSSIFRHYCSVTPVIDYYYALVTLVILHTTAFIAAWSSP